MCQLSRSRYATCTRWGLAVLAGWVVAHSLAVSVEGWGDEVAPADVGVVLGSKVNPDGTLSERLRQRLLCGLHLYRAGRVRRLLVSGGLGREGFYEGDRMRDFLRAQGVPASAIVVDNHGDNTQASACNARRLLGRSGRVVVVTQYFHVSRTRLLFRQAGFGAVAGASPRYCEGRDLYALLREFPAYYRALWWPAGCQPGG